MRHTYIRFHDTPRSEEYCQLTAHIYRMQATLTLQRAFRAKKKKKNLPVSQRKRIKVTRSDSMLRVISEPNNEKYLEFAEKINRGEYLTLDFNDADFVRHLFKALRLSKITLNQLLMAQDLFESQQWLRPLYSHAAPQVQSWQFPDGPYSPQQIEYATQAQCAAFLNGLSSEDKQYFTVNFSDDAEERLASELFFDAISLGFRHITGLNGDIIKQAIRKKNHNGLIKPEVFLRIKEWVESDSIALENEVVESIKECLPNYDVEMNDVFAFLAAGLVLYEQLPALVVSPDYDEQNITTPFLSLILLSNNAMNQLQRAVHGHEAVMQFPVAGQFDMRLIRYMIDDHTQPDHVFSLMKSLYPFFNPSAGLSRPLEITHPSLVPHHKPHGVLANNFLLTWHDKFHAWRSGCNFKALFQHMRNLHSQQLLGGLGIINPSIWKLSDMDFNLGRVVRTRERSVTRRDEFDLVLGYAFVNPRPDDFLLSIAFDMLKNQKFWLDAINQIFQPMVFISLDEYFSVHVQAADSSKVDSKQLQLLHLLQDDNLFMHIMAMSDQQRTAAHSKILFELCKNRGFSSSNLLRSIGDIFLVYDKIADADRHDFLLSYKDEITSMLTKDRFWLLANKLPFNHFRLIVEMYDLQFSMLKPFFCDLSPRQRKILNRKVDLHAYFSSNTRTRTLMLNLCEQPVLPESPKYFSFFCDTENRVPCGDIASNAASTLCAANH